MERRGSSPPKFSISPLNYILLVVDTISVNGGKVEHNYGKLQKPIKPHPQSLALQDLS